MTELLEQTWPILWCWANTFRNIHEQIRYRKCHNWLRRCITIYVIKSFEHFKY